MVLKAHPGQFFYHQWATNPYSITTSWDFVLNFTDKFEAQTVAGGPIKAFIQMPGSNTFENWTSHAIGICWNAANGCPANTGRITVNDVPAGATVWVMAHIDFKPIGSNISTLSPNPMTRPVTYGPLSSTITIRDQQTLAPIGTSYSQTTVIGRGKKVTMLYGTATNSAGAPLVDAWIQVKQGSNTVMTKTDLSGDYVLFDGQQCTSTDGIYGACTGAWSSAVTFGNGSVSTTMTLLGQGPVPSGAAAFPAGSTSAQVRTITRSTPSTTIVSPFYTFTAKKGEAANRTLRFMG